MAVCAVAPADPAALQFLLSQFKGVGAYDQLSILAVIGQGRFVAAAGARWVTSSSSRAGRLASSACSHLPTSPADMHALFLDPAAAKNSGGHKISNFRHWPPVSTSPAAGAEAPHDLIL